MKNKLNVLINIFFPIWIILTIALLLGCLAPLVDRYFSKSQSSDSSSYGLIVPAGENILDSKEAGFQQRNSRTLPGSWAFKSVGPVKREERFGSMVRPPALWRDFENKCILIGCGSTASQTGAGNLVHSREV
jgi:hypothetical protein